jgi:hypothetical protein
MCLFYGRAPIIVVGARGWRRARIGKGGRGMESAVNKTFSTKLQKSHKGGWTYVVWPQSVKFFGTKGLVKVTGTIDGLPFRASFMAMGDGRHMLPVKLETRRAIGKEAGQTVKIKLLKRLGKG